MLHLVDLDLYRKVNDKSYEELLFIQYKMLKSFLVMGFRNDIKNDNSFSIVDKQKIISYIQQYFFTDLGLSPSECVKSLFSNVDTPKQYFKKLL